MVAQMILHSQPKNSKKTSQRIQRLMQTEIAYVGSREFAVVDSDDVEEAKQLLKERAELTGAGSEHELPPHLACMCVSQLLTPHQEQTLFRYMNYLKFRANSLRSRLSPRTSSSADARAVERALAESQVVRDHLVHSNIRLVISIVRKHVSKQCTFDELLSEGLTALVQAAEKFDYGRGFRFSTYAYRVVSRSLFRFMQTRQRDSTRFVTASDAINEDSEAGSAESNLLDSAVDDLRDELSGFIAQLDRREQFIIRCRFALGSHRHARTLQEIADKLQVSKERVRQLEKRAIGKLKKMAEGLLDDDPLLVGWVS